MIFYVVLILLLAAGALAGWFFFLPRQVEKSLRRVQNDFSQQVWEETDRAYQQMRIWRHDYRNQLQTLKAYLAMGKTAEAQAFLGQLEQNLAQAEPTARSGNLAVDAMLGIKIRRMRELGIPVDVTAHVPGELPISGVDLAALLGNLLDNALEACMTAPAEERFVRIYMDVVKRQFYISVTNAMQGKARRENGLFRTTKGSNRGLGLIRIDQIVEHYGGSVNRQSEQGVFATEITLPTTTRA
ncbi:MAG: GHKL domain-containing protein [Clostridia bacterium]|nr:GHKL domain-containing protein [Clostridia bacterium]